MARPQHIGRSHRRHGAAQPVDRSLLEAAGWRTTLDYRENHVRGRDGRLTYVQAVWCAEAERAGGGRRAPQVIAATGPTAELAWARLRTRADLADVVDATGAAGAAHLADVEGSARRRGALAPGATAGVPPAGGAAPAVVRPRVNVF